MLDEQAFLEIAASQNWRCGACDHDIAFPYIGTDWRYGTGPKNPPRTSDRKLACVIPKIPRTYYRSIEKIDDVAISCRQCRYVQQKRPLAEIQAILQTYFSVDKTRWQQWHALTSDQLRTLRATTKEIAKREYDANSAALRILVNKYGLEAIIAERQKTNVWPVDWVTKQHLKEIRGMYCTYCDCKTTATKGPRQFTVEHTQPASKGGKVDALENQDVACYTCNILRSNYDEDVFRDALKYLFAHEHIAHNWHNMNQEQRSFCVETIQKYQTLTYSR